MIRNRRKIMNQNRRIAHRGIGVILRIGLSDRLRIGRQEIGVRMRIEIGILLRIGICDMLRIAGRKTGVGLRIAHYIRYDAARRAENAPGGGE